MRINRGLIEVTAAGALLGTAGTGAALMPAGTDPVLSGLLRLILGAITLILIVAVRDRGRSSHMQLLRIPALWVMAATAAYYQPTFFMATSLTGVGAATLVAVGSMPIFAGIVSRIVYKTSLHRAWYVATALSTVGLLFTSFGTATNLNVIGLLLALSTGLSTGIYVNAVRSVFRTHDDPIAITAFAFVLGSIASLPVLAAKWDPAIFAGTSLLVLLYLGVVTMAVANAMQIQGMKRVSPAIAAVLLLADPLTANILGITVLGESADALRIVGMLLVAAGLVVAGSAPSDDDNPEPVVLAG